MSQLLLTLALALGAVPDVTFGEQPGLDSDSSANPWSEAYLEGFSANSLSSFTAEAACEARAEQSVTIMNNDLESPVCCNVHVGRPETCLLCLDFHVRHNPGKLKTVQNVDSQTSLSDHQTTRAPWRSLWCHPSPPRAAFAEWWSYPSPLDATSVPRLTCSEDSRPSVSPSCPCSGTARICRRHNRPQRSACSDNIASGRRHDPGRARSQEQQRPHTSRSFRLDRSQRQRAGRAESHPTCVRCGGHPNLRSLSGGHPSPINLRSLSGGHPSPINLRSLSGGHIQVRLMQHPCHA